MVVDRLDEVAGIGRHAARSSSPRSGWTWASSPPRRTWCRGPDCHPGPSSPAPSTAPAPPARATATSRPRWGGRHRRRQDRHLPRRALPAPGQAHRQGQSPGRRRPLHPGDRLAPARRPTARFHDLGADYHASRIDRDRKTATSCTSSRRSTTRSPSSPPPDQQHPLLPLPITGQGWLHLPYQGSFSGQDEAGGSSPPRSTICPLTSRNAGSCFLTQSAGCIAGQR